MILDKGYILREIADSSIVIPVGQKVVDFKAMMTLNETGTFIWKNMTKEIEYEDLLKKVTDEYEIDEDTAREDLNDFISTAKQYGVIK